MRDVFTQQSMDKLHGRIGIGHCRYPTAGSEDVDEAQPFYVNSPYGIAFAHNGNLVNTEALRREMFEQDRRHINTNSDSEILLNILAHELQIQERMALTPDHIFKAVAGVHARASGGYACVALILGYGLVAFRDPHGIRPLVLGERETPERARVRGGLRVGRAGRPRLQASCATWRRARPSSSARTASSARAAAPRARCIRRASSSTSIWRAPTR